jgi:hypothetical protein
MNFGQLGQELLNEFGSILESLETQNAALLECLKHKNIISDEEMQPYVDQAAKASNVRWIAMRARLEHLFTSLEKHMDELTIAAAPKGSVANVVESNPRKNESAVGQKSHRKADAERKNQPRTEDQQTQNSESGKDDKRNSAAHSKPSETAQ